MAIMGGAYHGHTKAVIDLSPYKYEGPGGDGQQPYVHVLPCPDPYRCAWDLRSPLASAPLPIGNDVVGAGCIRVFNPVFGCSPGRQVKLGTPVLSAACMLQSLYVCPGKLLWFCCPGSSCQRTFHSLWSSKCVMDCSPSVMLCAALMVRCCCRNLHLDGRKAARQAIAEAHEAGAKIGAFFCESVLSCGGQARA